MKYAFILLAGLVLAPVTASAEETLAIPSYTPQNYTGILDGSYKKTPAALSGRLYLPSGGGRVPAVVVMHGSGGIRSEIEVSVAQLLQKKGIAALIVDSFKGRGLSRTGEDQGKLPMAATVLDGFQALLALRAHDRVDAKRIGAVGFSRGGVAAMFADQEPLRKAVLGESGGFAALMPVYPGCSTQWDKVESAGTPVKFLLGKEDNYTPAAKCERLAQRINAAGGKAEATEVAGGYHQFLLTRTRELDRVANFAKCDMGITPAGEMHYPKLGIEVGDNWRGFVRKVFKDCGKRGATLGGTDATRATALTEISQFFVTELKPGS